MKSIKVSDEFHKKVKIYAARTDKTIQSIIEESAEERMKDKKKK